MNDGIEAIKQIHAFGEYNALLVAIYVTVLLTLGRVGIKKALEIWGIETKASLYKKAQEARIESLEKAIKNLSKELDDREDNLYQKQKGYHEQSIQIRNDLKKNQEGLKTDLQEIKSLIINNSIESMRWEILDFSNAIMSGREYNKEQYDHVLDTHERYMKILEENDMTNGQTTASFGFIKKHYDELMETGFVSLSSNDNGVK
nr:MAG TPA: hypothetical protein [Caudoviricetes sp.]